MYLITSQIILLCLLTISRVSAQAVTMEWAANLSGSGTETAKSIALDVNGNVYTTGYFTGSVDFDPGAGVFTLSSAGQQDIFISKLNAAGDFVWAKRIGGYANDAANSITVDALGNVYTCGFYHSNVDFNPNAGAANLMSATINSQDIFISKLDANGNFVWAKSIGGTGYLDILGNVVDAVSNAYQLKLDATENVYVVGSFLGEIDFDPGAGLAQKYAPFASHAFIVKLNHLGHFRWVKTFGENMYGEEAYAVAIDPLGKIYITGVFAGSVDFNPNEANYFLSTNAYNACFVIALNEHGSFLWANVFSGNSSSNQSSGTSITVDIIHDIIVGGNFKGSLDSDPSANQNILNSSGNSDAYIIKLDANGNSIWGKCYGGISADYLYEITTDNLGNIYSVGSFKGNADFDPSSASYWQSSAAANTLDAYVLKLNSAGDFVWACHWGGLSNDQCNSINVNTNNDLFIAGYYSGIADLDPGTTVLNYSAGGSNDIFIEQLVQSVSGLPSAIVPIDEMSRMQNIGNTQIDVLGTEIKVYPNPCKDVLYITKSENVDIINIVLLNIQGKIMYSKKGLVSTSLSLDIKNLRSGIYFLQLNKVAKSFSKDLKGKEEIQIIKVLKW